MKERLLARELANGGSGDFSISALGSGSDYTPFIQYAGIASLNIGFGGENGGGEYHTIYDTYTHFKRFKDPDMAYGLALARVAGRLSLRLANAEVLPFTFGPWEKTVSGYLEEVISTADTMRKESESRKALIAKNAFGLAADPTKPRAKPAEEADIPYLDFSPLQNALAGLAGAVKILESKDPQSLPPDKKAQLNRLLMEAEHQLTDQAGLPRRPWYKHQIYAPGFYTGYGVKTLPGVREAIEQKNWEEAQAQIGRLAGTLSKMTDHLKKMNQLFQ